MAKKIMLWSFGIALLALGLFWQAFRHSDIVREWTAQSEVLGFLAMAFGWATLITGAFMIVRALAKNDRPSEEPRSEA